MTIAPEQMPDGKVAVMLVPVQAETDIAKPPMVTVPLELKLTPSIVTLLPGVPFRGDTEVMAGVIFKV